MNKEIISAAVKARIERFNRLYKEAVGYTFEEEVEVENQRYEREMEEYNKGMEMCIRYWLKAYEHDCLEWDKEQNNTVKALSFLQDLFNTDIEGLKSMTRQYS